MTQYKTAPDHVELIRSEGHLSNVAGNDVPGLPGGKHLRTQIDPDRTGDILNPPPNAASGIKQAFAWQATKHFTREFFVERTRCCFVSISPRPPTIRIAHMELFELRLPSGQRENSFRNDVPQQSTNINYSASFLPERV
jgi:hypothetical protein